jgi:hypothetical protein
MGSSPETPTEAFIRIYASLARAPEYAMTLASKMALSSVQNRDFDTVMRWANNYDELYELFGSDEVIPDDVVEAAFLEPPSDGPTSRSAAE